VQEKENQDSRPRRRNNGDMREKWGSRITTFPEIRGEFRFLRDKVERRGKGPRCRVKNRGRSSLDGGRKLNFTLLFYVVL